MKKLLRRIKPNLEKGQSLVEMAITAPILIFMLLGVFEVGWALRGYLVLTNVNREVTRFAVRQGYLNYSVKDNNPATAAATVGYDDVVSYTYTTLSDQLALNFSAGQTDTLTSTLIISHIVVDTAMPCVDMATCNCNEFMNPANPNFYLNGTNVLTYDDLILHPGKPGYEYFYAQKFPPSSTYQTQLVYTNTTATLARQNNKFNCELLKKSGGTIPASNNVIITEVFYRQRQLFGFPLISNPVTDPVPMYAHTAMRIIVSSRSGENVDTVGPTCDAYPFIIRKLVVDAAPINSTLDIYDGNGPDDFGWLGWNGLPTTNLDAGYLGDELTYPRMALNDFYDAREPSDRTLSVGDYVASLSGVNATVESSDGFLTSLIGKTIRIPVWDNFYTSPNPDHYHISAFIWVRIESAAGFEGPPGWTSSKNIFATYLGDASQDCPAD